MKKFCYLLSIAAHVLVLLIVLNTRFPITIRPGPPRVVVVSIAEPPPPRFEGARRASLQRGGKAMAEEPGRGPGGAAAERGRGEGVGTAPAIGGLAFPPQAKLGLTPGRTGDFRLAPVGRSPEPWALPIVPAPAPRIRRDSAYALRPAGVPGGAGGPGSVFLLPFDAREKVVADWVENVMARIARNWIIPASGRLAFPGRVQITLTIEPQGGQRSLVIDDANVPEPLTQAALHAIQASLPLPPIPENVSADSLAFTFVFAYNA
jgi:hypothetical protein